jgi:hypothetical protein
VIIGSSSHRKCFSWLTAILVGVTSLCVANRALTAEAREGAPARVHNARAHRSVSVTERHIVVERRALPQIALGGTAVLRGSRSPGSNIGQAVPQPAPAVPGEGYGSTNNGRTGLLPAGAGGDSGLDTSGFDRTGLNPENPH